NGSIFTLCCGPSSGFRSASPSGLPITNSPPGIGTIWNLTSVLRIGSVYGFISASVFASARLSSAAKITSHPHQPPAQARAIFITDIAKLAFKGDFLFSDLPCGFVPSPPPRGRGLGRGGERFPAQCFCQRPFLRTL